MVKCTPPETACEDGEALVDGECVGLAFCAPRARCWSTVYALRLRVRAKTARRWSTVLVSRWTSFAMNVGSSSTERAPPRWPAARGRSSLTAQAYRRAL